MSIFTILSQPVAILVTASLILVKVTNDRFIFYIQKITLVKGHEPMLYEAPECYYWSFLEFYYVIMKGPIKQLNSKALYLSGTYCHKTSTRPPSCQLLDNRLYILFFMADQNHKANIWIENLTPFKSVAIYIRWAKKIFINIPISSLSFALLQNFNNSARKLSTK